MTEMMPVSDWMQSCKIIGENKKEDFLSISSLTMLLLIRPWRPNYGSPRLAGITRGIKALYRTLSAAEGLMFNATSKGLSV